MSQVIYYDRAKIFLSSPTIPFFQYLPEGQVLRFFEDVSRVGQHVQGFSPTGDPTGILVGNNAPAFGWTETVVQASDNFNWSHFTLANPDLVMTAVLYSVGQVAPSKTSVYTVITKTDERREASSQGTVATRTLSFIAARYN